MVGSIFAAFHSRWSEYILLRDYIHKNVHGGNDQSGHFTSIMEPDIVTFGLCV